MVGARELGVDSKQYAGMADELLQSTDWLAKTFENADCGGV